MTCARALAPTLLLALLLPLGCAAPSFGQEAALTTGYVRHQGKRRSYHYRIPPQARANQPLPTLFVVHGGGGSGPRTAETTTYLQHARREGFLVVFPDAWDSSGRGNTQWNDGREGFFGRGDPSQLDDVGFFRKLFERAVQAHGADPQRLYVVGLSNGGMMTQRLAIELGDQIAAAAAVVANLPTPLAGARPPRPIPMLLMPGTADPHMPYAGGSSLVLGAGTVLSTADTLRFWVEHNRGAGRPRTTSLHLPDRDRSDDSTVERTRVLNLAAPVELWTVHGGGHALPGSPGETPRRAGTKNMDIDGARVIWEFVSRHRL